MARNKIETDFRNKLNQREINPTPQAWDRLDAMLAIAEEKKPKRKYPWMYIAASIVVILSVGIEFFTQNDKGIEVKSNEVVIENNESTEVPELEKTKSIITTSTNTDKVVIAETEKVKSSQEKKEIASPLEKQTFITNQNQIAEKKNINLVVNANGSENQKEMQQEIQTNTTEILIAEVSIKTEKANKTKVKVDANDLLSQVNGELELTFRKKVIKKVGENYNAVKVALTNRNYE